eukprot:COSAG03_NODE_7546_length_902_cov_67.071928_2_plen_47_part_01
MEQVQPEIRGSIIGFWIGIETVLSAFSAPAAAYLATVRNKLARQLQS